MKTHFLIWYVFCLFCLFIGLLFPSVEACSRPVETDRLAPAFPRWPPLQKILCQLLPRKDHQLTFFLPKPLLSERTLDHASCYKCLQLLYLSMFLPREKLRLCCDITCPRAAGREMRPPFPSGRRAAGPPGPRPTRGP